MTTQPTSAEIGNMRAGARMSETPTSVLVLSTAPEIAELVEAAAVLLAHVSVDRCESAISEVGSLKTGFGNGHALVIADIAPENADDMQGLRDLVAAVPDGTAIIAMTHNDLPLSAARGLTRLGVGEILPVSVSADELREVMRETLAPAQAPAPAAPPPAPAPAAPVQRGAVIAVASARGGCGATSVALNVAHQLLGRGGLFSRKPTHKVALVDLDLQFGDLGTLLDLEDRGTMAQILRSDMPPDESYLASAMLRHASGLHLLTAPNEPVPLDAMSADHVAAILDGLAAQYDYVVVDMPHALVVWLEPILKRAGLMLLVTDTSVPSIRQCKRLSDFYTEDAPLLPIEIVVNGEKRPLMMSGPYKEAQKVLGNKLKHWVPRNDRMMRRAVDRGEPVVRAAPRGDVARAYAKLATGALKSLSAKTSQPK